MIEIYTDGACFPNPGKGGWGWTTLKGDEAFGGEAPTTNQRMEVIAVIQALTYAFTRGWEKVKIVSDSQYVIKGCTEWRDGWETGGWRNSRGAPVANQDLWRVLYGWVDRVQPVFEWVKGHSGNPGNEAADKLSVKGSGCTASEVAEAERRLRAFKSYAAEKRENV